MLHLDDVYVQCDFLSEARASEVYPGLPIIHACQRDVLVLLGGCNSAILLHEHLTK